MAFWLKHIWHLRRNDTYTIWPGQIRQGTIAISNCKFTYFFYAKCAYVVCCFVCILVVDSAGSCELRKNPQINTKISFRRKNIAYISWYFLLTIKAIVFQRNLDQSHTKYKQFSPLIHITPTLLVLKKKTLYKINNHICSLAAKVLLMLKCF